MPIGIGALGLALGAVGQGAQMIGQAAANKKQFKQTKELMNIQKDHNREAAEYNNEMQMKMWKETGPTGQMEQLKAAGLNPGLIYGMGGAGGQTAQAAQQAPVSGGQAQVKNVAEGAGGMGLMMASQIGLMQAQKNKLEAEAEDIRGSANNRPKIGDNLEANTANTNQNTLNLKAQEALTKMQTRVSDLEGQFREATFNDAVSTIYQEQKQAYQELLRMKRENLIGDATVKEQIGQVRANLAWTLTDKALKEQQTTESKSRIVVNEATIKQIYNRIYQEWGELEYKGKNANTMEAAQQHDAWVRDIQGSTGLSISIIENILRAIPGGK